MRLMRGEMFLTLKLVELHVLKIYGKDNYLP
jgi:hypothetical protein